VLAPLVFIVASDDEKSTDLWPVFLEKGILGHRRRLPAFPGT
jgi:hypothetical protein